MRRGLWLACGFALALAMVAGAQNTTEIRNTVFNAGTRGNTLKLSGYTVSAATVTLTNDEIKALPTTPKTLVAAPGAGKRVKPVLPPMLHLTNAAGVYANVNATYATLVVAWTGGSWATSPIVNDSALTTDATDMTTFFHTSSAGTGWIVDLSVPFTRGFDAGSTSGAAEWITSFAGSTPQAGNVQGENMALELNMDNNGSGNLTGGNAANSLKVIIYYSLETF